MIKKMLGLVYGLVLFVVVFFVPLLAYLAETDASPWIPIVVFIIGIGSTGAIAESGTPEHRIGYALAIAAIGLLTAVCCAMDHVGVGGYVLLGIAFVQLMIFLFFMLPGRKKENK